MSRIHSGPSSQRLVLLNLFALSLLALVQIGGGLEAAYKQNFVGLLVCGVILLLGLDSLRRCFIVSREIQNDFDNLEAGESELVTTYQRQFAADPATAKELLEETLAARLSRIDFVTVSTPKYGFFGTVIGLIMAISLDAFAGQDLSEAMMEIVFQLFSGLAVAFYTTLFGLAVAIWNGHNHFELEEAQDKLIRQVVSTALAKIASSQTEGEEQ